MNIAIPSLAALPEAAAQFVALMPGHSIFAFYGTMGAGKTTFIKEVCRQLGVTDPVASPTFALVNEYSLPAGRRLFHFDFYRIRSLAEVYDMGYEDYFYSGDPCFLEWPELVEPLLPDDTVRIRITSTSDTSRRLEVAL